MKIEAGKYYKDAEGNKVGPMHKHDEYWISDDTDDELYFSGSDSNLIEEWKDEPYDHPMPTDDDLISFNLRNAASMLIEAKRYEDAISILYILKGDNE